ncbi:MAG TPA: thioesterase family protein [Bdellovibrionales bacterium]|nr:thioesterase family protein [Bdellovibrionales bacterium]
MKNTAKKTFVHRRRVTFYETDQMGVMHHSNHVRVFEEARVEWLRDRGLLLAKGESGNVIFAVVDVQVRYLRPLRFDEILETYVEGRMEGAKVLFRYAIWSPSQKTFAATGSTTLVPLDVELRPVRLTQDAREKFAGEEWAEVWPPALTEPGV